MTLTRTQIHERLGCLSGELKAARELEDECARDLAAKEHTVTLAHQAWEKAQANVKAKMDERFDLAEQYRRVAIQVGDAPVAEEGFGQIEGAESFADTMLDNANQRVNGAFERATN